jgi:hypothetical protein
MDMLVAAPTKERLVVLAIEGAVLDTQSAFRHADVPGSNGVAVHAGVAGSAEPSFIVAAVDGRRCLANGTRIHFGHYNWCRR